MEAQLITSGLVAVTAVVVNRILHPPAIAVVPAVPVFPPTPITPTVAAASAVVSGTCGLLYYRRENVYNVGRGTTSLLRRAKNKIGSGFRTMTGWFFRSIRASKPKRAEAIREVLHPDVINQTRLQTAAEINERIIANPPQRRARRGLGPRRTIVAEAVARRRSERLMSRT